MSNRWCCLMMPSCRDCLGLLINSGIMNCQFSINFICCFEVTAYDGIISDLRDVIDLGKFGPPVGSCACR